MRMIKIKLIKTFKNTKNKNTKYNTKYYYFFKTLKKNCSK